MCDIQCLREYIDDNLKSYTNGRIDIKFECWAVKLGKCDGHLVLQDVNYPQSISFHLQQNNNGTILDNKTYKMYKDIMMAYDEKLGIGEREICVNPNCLKPFRVNLNRKKGRISQHEQRKSKSKSNKIRRRMDDESESETESDSNSGSIVYGKIFHCNCCSDEIHGKLYDENGEETKYQNGDSENENESNARKSVYFDLFYCNICDKKYCRICRENCFYSIEMAMKYNKKVPKYIKDNLGKYQDDEGLDCCEICWFRYYCRQCPHCKYEFCSICKSEWNGVTRGRKQQQVKIHKVKSKNQSNAKTVWIVQV